MVVKCDHKMWIKFIRHWVQLILIISRIIVKKNTSVYSGSKNLVWFKFWDYFNAVMYCNTNNNNSWEGTELFKRFLLGLGPFHDRLQKDGQEGNASLGDTGWIFNFQRKEFSHQYHIMAKMSRDGWTACGSNIAWKTGLWASRKVLGFNMKRSWESLEQEEC